MLEIYAGMVIFRIILGLVVIIFAICFINALSESGKDHKDERRDWWNDPALYRDNEDEDEDE